MTEAGDRGGDGRRRALKVLFYATSATFGCALAAPAVVFAVAPAVGKGAGSGGWTRTVKLDSLPEGQPTKVSIVADRRDAWSLDKDVVLGAVWLIRKGDHVEALSATCPHLGCSVNLDTGGKGFACPCHTSAFDAEGHRVSGPSPRDMDPMETRVEDGYVAVAFRRYRISVPQRVEIG